MVSTSINRLHHDKKRPPTATTTQPTSIHKPTTTLSMTIYNRSKFVLHAYQTFKPRRACAPTQPNKYANEQAQQGLFDITSLNWLNNVNWDIYLFYYHIYINRIYSQISYVWWYIL